MFAVTNTLAYLSDEIEKSFVTLFPIHQTVNISREGGSLKKTGKKFFRGVSQGILTEEERSVRLTS
jgi:hypothetical protein